MREVSRFARRLRRAQAAAARARLYAQLDEAWRERDAATSWQLAHRLARRGRGPRRRVFYAPDRERPSAAEWRDFLEKPAQEGGLAARCFSCFSDLQAEVRRVADEVAAAQAPPPGVRSEAVAGLARADVPSIRWALRRRTRKRRGIQAWSLPAELWHMLIWPHFRLRRGRAGVGAAEPPLARDGWWRRLGEFAYHMRATRRAPTLWNVSRAWDIDKRNDKGGPAGRRVIHGFCPFGTSVPGVARTQFSCRWWAQLGCCMQASPIALRRTMPPMHSLASVDTEFCAASASKLYCAGDQPYFMQRLYQSAAAVVADDWCFFASPDTGVMMGHTAAAVEFAFAYQKVLRDYNAWQNLHLANGLLLSARLPGLPPVDLAFTAYADDTLAKVVVGRPSVALWARLSGENTEGFRRCLEPAGVRTNGDKKRSLLVTGGPGANTMRRELLSQPGTSVVRVLRYLGCLIDHRLSASPEVSVRARAATSAWRTMGDFWSSRPDGGETLCVLVSRRRHASLRLGAAVAVAF